MSGKLVGKVAVITGGTSGIGLATARRFAGEGARVVVTGRRQRELEAARKLLGEDAVAIQGDVASLADLDRLFAAVQSRFGGIDVLFANAGTGSFLPLGAISEEQYQTTFDTNVKGMIFTVQKALPLLRDGGTIVLNASTAAAEGMPAFSVYAASKAAVRNLARGWATDLKNRKIRVNVVSPGVVITPGYKLLGLSDEQIQGFAAQMATRIPLGRTGEADEIANAVLFLASDDSSFVNGIELVVDGGMTQV